MPKMRKKLGREGQQRVSEKISKLVREGTPDGRGQAGAIAHSMERSGRLGPRGAYRPAGRSKRYNPRVRQRRSHK